MNNSPTVAQREIVFQRAQGYCEYCRSSIEYGVQAFECEHIVPISQGGKTILTNLAFACGGCNRAKGTLITAIDPDSGQKVPLFNPRQQFWHDHFIWSGDFTLIIGLTAIGRATVVALRLNRPGVVNLRRVLVAIGDHPPTNSAIT